MRGNARAKKIAQKKARRLMAQEEWSPKQVEVIATETALNRITFIANCRRQKETHIKAIFIVQSQSESRQEM